MVALLLLAGVCAIFPGFRYRLLKYLRFGSWMKEPARQGLIGEFWLGTQLGLLWTPCAGPVLGSILILAAVKHDTAAAFVLLILYGLGAGIPLLAIAYGGRYLSQQIRRLRPYSVVLQRVGGVIVVTSAMLLRSRFANTILIGWDVQIQLWLAPMFPTLPL